MERKLLAAEIISTRIWASMKVVVHFILGKMTHGKKLNPQVLPPFFVFVYFHNRSLMATVIKLLAPPYRCLHTKAIDCQLSYN
jgi:hypothetical protein